MKILCFAIWTEQPGSLASGTRHFRSVPPVSFSYGTHYTREMINEALTLLIHTLSFPHRIPTDMVHFLASIAAGSGNPAEQFIGAAPEATIAVVKLKQAKQYLRDYYFIPESARLFRKTISCWACMIDICRHCPKIFLLSFALLLAAILADIPAHCRLPSLLSIYTFSPIRVPVIGVGNEADKRHHFYSEIQNLSDTKNRRDPRRRKYFRIYDGTLDRSSYILSISLTSPSGESTSRIPIRAGTSTTFQFLFEQTTVNIDDRFVCREYHLRTYSFSFFRCSFRHLEAGGRTCTDH